MVTGLGRQRGLEMFARWTDRIAAGEVPPAPPRPQGRERNLVLTMWDWGGPATFAHDELTTDKRNPDGQCLRPDLRRRLGERRLPDRRSARAHGAGDCGFRCSTRKCRPARRSRCRCRRRTGATSCIGTTRRSPTTRRWTARAACGCRRGSACPRTSRPSARRIRRPRWRRRRAASGRCSTSIPKTRQFKQVNICFDTHHVQFAADKDETLYGNGVFSGAIGWINTRILDETGDEAAAQGWCRAYHDIESGRQGRSRRRSADRRQRHLQRHPASERRQRLGRRARPDAGQDPPHRSQDLRRRGLRAAVRSGGRRRRLHAARHRRRLERRDLDGAGQQRPPRQLRSPQVQGPLQGPAADGRAALPRRLDAASGARARDSRTCAATWPWTSSTTTSSTAYNTFGLGDNVPFANGTNSDSLLALQPDGTLAGAAGAVSARVLLARHGRPHRRSEGGLEGARASTRTTDRTPTGTSRAASARAARSSSSSSGRIRWRSSRHACTHRLRTHRPRAGDRRAVGSALAHVDLAGGWGQRFHEDLPERGAGPDIGDYLGLPINDAARLRADSWDAGKWTMPERQCEPHPADYAPRGPASMRICEHGRSRVAGRDLVAHDDDVDAAAPHDLHGRARPSVGLRAAHWQGFSTGEWEGDMLKVTTTHLKEGWLRRNGVPRSEKATLIEYFIRHGEYLTLVTVVKDPGLSHRGVRAHVELGGRSRIPAQPVLLHSDASRSSARATRCRTTCPATNQYLTSSRTKHGLPSRGGARRRPRRCIPDFWPRCAQHGAR